MTSVCNGCGATRVEHTDDGELRRTVHRDSPEMDRCDDCEGWEYFEFEDPAE